MNPSCLPRAAQRLTLPPLPRYARSAAAVVLLLIASTSRAIGPVDAVAGKWEGEVWQSYGRTNGKVPTYYYVGTLSLRIASKGHTRFALSNSCEGEGLAMPATGGYTIDLLVKGCPYPEMNGRAYAHLSRKGDFKIVIMRSFFTKVETVGKLSHVSGGVEQDTASSVEFGNPKKSLQIREQ